MPSTYASTTLHSGLAIIVGICNGKMCVYTRSGLKMRKTDDWLVGDGGRALAGLAARLAGRITANVT